MGGRQSKTLPASAVLESSRKDSHFCVPYKAQPALFPSCGGQTLGLHSKAACAEPLASASDLWSTGEGNGLSMAARIAVSQRVARDVPSSLFSSGLRCSPLIAKDPSTLHDEADMSSFNTYLPEPHVFLFGDNWWQVSPPSPTFSSTSRTLCGHFPSQDPSSDECQGDMWSGLMPEGHGLLMCLMILVGPCLKRMGRVCSVLQ